jgi:hypothetical protein
MSGVGRNQWGECEDCGRMSCESSCPRVARRTRELEELDRRHIPVSPGEYMLRLLDRI